MNDERVVVVIGAGGTVADCMNRSERTRPPLDRGFFHNALRDHESRLRPVTAYLRKHYRIDLRDDRYDSLEQVMAILYTDMYGGHLVEEAARAFRVLVRTFLIRLAETTNKATITRRCRLYRLIAGFLKRENNPENLTIVTFNQDIQIEKALDAIASTAGRKDRSIFLFPHCYGIRAKRLTGPGDRRPQFAEASHAEGGVTLLKLHGSLNWYSTHRSADPPLASLFNARRAIGITRRKEIDTGMRVRSATGKSSLFSFPIVIPPVVHKSGMLHEQLKPIWTLAEDRLAAAHRVIFFGYSCPQTDWESANLIGRSLTRNEQLKEVSVIDRNPAVLLRFVQVARLKAVNYYASCDAYLGAE